MASANTIQLLADYKLRTNIWKHLNSRTQAIHSALNVYNTLASKVQPPAKTIEWDDLMNLTFVADFDLIRSSHGDANILSKPWMSQANREVCNKLYKIIRAREEITRLNVEVTRLRTYLHYESLSYRRAIETLKGNARHLLAAEVLERHEMRLATNNRHHLVLNKIEGLEGFSGKKGKGIPKGWTEEMVRAAGIFEPPDGESEGEGIAELEREESREDLCRLTSVVENLTI